LNEVLGRLGRLLWECLRDLLPIILVVTFFQVLVLREPFPNIDEILVGLLFVIMGLALFIQGLEMGLFPLGESMAQAFAKKGSLVALLGFSFALGFGTTVAEPALIAVADEAAEVAGAAGAIADTLESREDYAYQLRLTVALSVGVSLVLGVMRILKGWSLPLFIIVGYLLVVGMTPLAPPEIVGIAYDSGGVTTSTITVPLVTALGVGLASAIRGRNPLLDGFGLIAFASLLPMIFVLGFGMITG
jgi:hypothetical protein